jgi:hypothetical protein
VGKAINSAINPKIMVCLNCINQKITKNTLSKNKNGKAKPKKAGNQKTYGEIYFAKIATNKQTIIT